MFFFNSPKDIANLKNEIEKRQKEGGDAEAIENGDVSKSPATESIIGSETMVVPPTAAIQS